MNDHIETPSNRLNGGLVSTFHRLLLPTIFIVFVASFFQGDGANASQRSERESAAERVRPLEQASGGTARIEGPPNALAHFYSRLAAAEQRQTGAVARVVLYSDSINGWDGVSSALRHALQARFGDAGKGWVHIAPGWTYQHHRDVRWTHSDDWRTHVVNRGHGPGNRYGFGGVMAADGSRRSNVVYETTEDHPSGGAVSLFRLFYQAYPNAGSVRISVDGGEPVEVATAAASMEDRVHDIRVPDGPHRFQVSVGERNVRLYGAVLEREGPGVVVDAVALIGARVARLLRMDAGHFRRQIELRQPDLMIFWLGANNVTSQGWGRTAFVRDYGRAIATARRGRPEASCLVASVTDIGERGSGDSIPRTPDVVQAQREVATAQGCAFFNVFEAMGGAGSMNRWYRGSPRLSAPDFRHLTPQGAVRMGGYFSDAIISGYDASRSR